MEREKTRRWIKHYCSDHKILLVGEGDFSFAACLATSFGDASNIVATSLDSKEELRYKYPDAMANLERIEFLGCVVIHQVNAHTMSHHPLLQYKLFDRIVFNFPHATLLYKEHDPLQIRDHQELVKGFLKSARDLLTRGGEVHVTHKTGYPYSDWEIQFLALDVGLHLVEAPSFSLWDYPGYFNKRGYGPHYGHTFPVGTCRTFVFQAIPFPWRYDPAPSRACDYPTLLTSTFGLYNPTVPSRAHHRIRYSPYHSLFGQRHSQDTHYVTRPAPVVHQRLPGVIRPRPYLLPPPSTRPLWPVNPEPHQQQFWATSSSSQLPKDFSLEFYDRKELQFMGNRSSSSLQQTRPSKFLY